MRSAVVTFIVVAFVLGVVMWTSPPPKAPPPQPGSTATAPQSTIAEVRGDPSADPAASPPDPMQREQREQEERMAFHERVRTFFAQAPALPADEKQRTARQLDAEIAAYESRRELSAMEALTLRLALIRESAPEREQLERMEALRDAYRARDAVRAQQAPDPMFELYKAREQEIVAQVQSLQEIPGGLTREEYLRERLQQEREALFGESSR